MSTSAHDCSVERIRALHAWYCENVMDVPLVPEFERRWLAFFKQGHNGKKLSRVIWYLRQQISAGKRNPGALKLTNLLEWAEDGVLMRFCEDYALASAALGGRLGNDRKLAPVPDGEGGAAVAPRGGQAPAQARPAGDPESGRRALEDLLALRSKLK